MQQRLAALPSDLMLTRYLADHLAGLLALVAGRPNEAKAPLDRAGGLEPELPICRCAGSARLLQARLLLDRGQTEAALGIADPVLREWEQAGTPGCALLDGPLTLPVLRLAAQRGAQAAARMVALFPAPSPEVTGPAGRLPEPLTQREQEVLRLIVAGRTNRQIGTELYIAEETVKSHVVHILHKLGVSSRTQAAVRGRELGF